MANPPSHTDAQAFKQALSDWIAIDDCEELVSIFLREHGKFARGLRTGKLWRECYHAVRFARAAQIEEIRIGSDPPDFEFKTSDTHYDIELVVARDVDDSTSEQFVKDAEFIGPRKKSIKLIGVEALADSWNGLPNRIAEQVRAKSRKGYPTSFVLAVAASILWDTDQQESMESAIRKSCLPYIQSFSDIWIMAGSHFFSLRDSN